MAHALRLLRRRGKRPCGQRAKRGDELAPPHVLLTLRLKMTAYHIEWVLLCVTAKLGRMSALGHKRTLADVFECPLRAKSGRFKVQTNRAAK